MAATRSTDGQGQERQVVDPSQVVDAAAVADLVAAALRRQPVPAPLALNVTEACAALGVGWDFWRAHVEPDLRLVRRGGRKLVPVAELERWLDEHAERALDTGGSTPGSGKSPANRGVRASRVPDQAAA